MNTPDIDRFKNLINIVMLILNISFLSFSQNNSSLLNYIKQKKNHSNEPYNIILYLIRYIKENKIYKKINDNNEWKKTNNL